MRNRRKTLKKVAFSCLSIGLITITMPLSAFSQSMNTETTKKEIQERKYKQGEILVKFKDGRSVQSIPQERLKYNLTEKMEFPLSQTQLLSINNLTSTVDQVIKDLLGTGLVEYAEPNYERTFTAVMDPGYDKQWGMNNTGQYISGVPGTPDVDVNIEGAWAQTKGSNSVVVAVIDSGVDISHPDLQNQIWKNPGEIPGDGIDNDRNGYVDDVNGWNFVDNNPRVFVNSDEDEHGTHVAGVIAASHNQMGVMGVAPRVKVMPLKIMAHGGYVSDVLKAIEYAKAKGVKIINMSFGGSDFSQAEYNLMKNTNALFVVAAGNDSRNIDGYFSSYPAAYDLPNIITVTAVNHRGEVPYWANYGTTHTDLAAPGVVIYSTLPGNSYGYYSGTSMAAPFVTGTAALILSKKPSASPVEIKNILLNNTTPLSSLSWKVNTGGMLNAGKAVRTMNGSVRTVNTQQEEVQSTPENTMPSLFTRMMQRFLLMFKG